MRPEKGAPHSADRPSGQLAQLAQLREEIALRVRPVCPSMPAEEFDRMVEAMAVIELKYMLGDTWRNRRD